MGISRQQAIDCFHSDDLIGIGMEADAVRRRLHPEGVVSYVIDRNINYTNFCTEYCTFCAFYQPAEGQACKPKATSSDFETRSTTRLRETEELGGTGVLMQGGIHPDLKIDWFEAHSYRGIKQRFPNIWLHCLSASARSSPSPSTAKFQPARHHHAAARRGARNRFPGGGAEILDDDVRQASIARLKCRTEDWVSVHRIAHELGMRTTATMMFGVGETMEQRVNHFEVVHRLQEETGGFTAFIPWSLSARPYRAWAVVDGMRRHPWNT